MTTTYAVSVHQPGCLPESEPFVTTDLADARQAVADEIAVFWDTAGTGAESEAECESIDARYRPLFEAAAEVAPGTSIYVRPIGLYGLGWYVTLDVVTEDAR